MHQTACMLSSPAGALDEERCVGARHDHWPGPTQHNCRHAQRTAQYCAKNLGQFLQFVEDHNAHVLDQFSLNTSSAASAWLVSAPVAHALHPLAWRSSARATQPALLARVVCGKRFASGLHHQGTDVSHLMNVSH